MIKEQPGGALSKAKALCVAHTCPKCRAHHVTVEQVLNSGKTMTRCHCRSCGHSWHLVIQDSVES